MLDQNDVKTIKELIKEGINDGVKPLEEKITGIEGKITGIEERVTGIEGKITGIEGKITGIENQVTGIEKEMVKKSEFDELFVKSFEKAFEPYAVSLKTDFNDLGEKISSIEKLLKETKATGITEIDLNSRISRLNSEFSLISREERGIIVKLLKDKKIITEEEARELMSIKTFVNQTI